MKEIASANPTHNGWAVGFAKTSTPKIAITLQDSGVFVFARRAKSLLQLISLLLPGEAI